jgi:hypothetical protein
MRTYHHRITRLAKPVYFSRRALRTGAIVVGLILLVDVITVRYFPQVQSALTLPPQTNNASNGSALQLPAMTNGATASNSRGTATTGRGSSSPVAKPTTTTMPGTMVLAQDTFARPNQPLWGTASNGEMWSADAAQSPAFSIVNHAGLVSNGSGIFDAILGTRTADSEVLFSGSVSRFPASNMGALLRWTDSNNMYKVFIDGTDLIALKKVNGVVSELQSVPFPAQNGRSYIIRARVVGKSIMARVWPASQAEPSAWMLTATDSDLASGFDGMRLIVQNGVTITITSFLESQA